MPIYEYECLACKARFERSQRFTDPPVSECPQCSSSVRRVFFPAGVVFKGSGWYSTDSRKPAASESSTPSSATASSDGKAATKTETKTESKSEGGVTAGSSAKGESGPKS
ncbi:MAG: zinc ribbon domain-containing protein [Chloroflexi bacterium]|nr:zinc ribbon domain-containing protein [Chloroflexota bacterium]